MIFVLKRNVEYYQKRHFCFINKDNKIDNRQTEDSRRYAVEKNEVFLFIEDLPLCEKNMILSRRDFARSMDSRLNWAGYHEILCYANAEKEFLENYGMLPGSSFLTRTQEKIWIPKTEFANFDIVYSQKP